MPLIFSSEIYHSPPPHPPPRLGYSFNTTGRREQHQIQVEIKAMLNILKHLVQSGKIEGRENSQGWPGTTSTVASTYRPSASAAAARPS